MSKYNIDANVIAQALRGGCSQEEIANMFAAALNQASATVQQERAIQKQAEANKMKAAGAVADFYNTYYPEMFGGNEKATAETIIKACEAVKKMTHQANEIASKLKLDPKNAVENPLFRIFNL